MFASTAIAAFFMLGDVVSAQSLGGSSYASSLMKTFGGSILYTYPCTCTAGTIWNVVIGAPSNITLSYTVGSQKYSYYNLPYAGKVLGFYNSATKNACYMIAYPSCYVIPTSGMITPLVGSSGY